MTTDPIPEERLVAMSRACRFVAAYRAGDTEGYAAAVNEARGDGTLLVFAMSLGVLCADLSDKVHGARAQLNLDGLALDSAAFRDQELARLTGSGSDDTQ